MGVAVDYHVGMWETSSERGRKPAMRLVAAEGDRPQKSGGLLQPAAPVAVDEHDPPALHDELSMERQRRQVAVVVAPHRLDRGDPGELFQGGFAVDVPGVKD